MFVRNTTEAINVLSASLPEGTRVLSTPVEHHANMLPWRRHDVRPAAVHALARAGCSTRPSSALRSGRYDLSR